MGVNGSMCQQPAQGFQANVSALKDQADNAKSKLREKTRQSQVIEKQNTLDKEKNKYTRLSSQKQNVSQNNQLVIIITQRYFALNNVQDMHHVVTWSVVC